MINHSIFIYQTYLQDLVCNVWCRASNEQTCGDLLSADFKTIYQSRDWVKKEIDDIYEECKSLTDDERTRIREAFFVNNGIEDLCEAIRNPIALEELPCVVKNKMKPLLVRFYDELISKKEKLDYYKKLIENNNNFKFCPCCGLTPIESPESHYREDNDHFLPKANYPFAVVNFSNLPPLCSKCNKKCKSTKNPFENRRKAFYAFKELANEFEISVEIDNRDEIDYSVLNNDEIRITFNNDPEKVATWDWLFEIKSRYNEEIRQFSKSELRTLANKFRRNTERRQEMSYEQIVKDVIEDYEIDRYDDRKFLKASFLKEILQKPEWMKVYDELIR